MEYMINETKYFFHYVKNYRDIKNYHDNILGIHSKLKVYCNNIFSKIFLKILWVNKIGKIK